MWKETAKQVTLVLSNPQMSGIEIYRVVEGLARISKME